MSVDEYGDSRRRLCHGRDDGSMTDVGEIVFSVVVPTLEREEKVAVCLRALAALDYDSARFEVIVVDDGGRTPLEPVVARWHGRLQLTSLSQDHGGPAAARNAGARQARGRFVAFIGDDCAPARDWLSKLEERCLGNPDCAVGGGIANGLPDNVYSTASYELIDYLHAYYNPHPDDARFFTPNNLAFPREAFLAIGGFDASFAGGTGEDLDLCARWLSTGRRMIYAPEASVTHAHELTLLGFLRQQLLYGRGSRQFRRVTAARTGGAVRLEPWWFYTGLLAHPLRGAGVDKPLRVAALLATAQLAAATAYLVPDRSG